MGPRTFPNFCVIWKQQKRQIHETALFVFEQMAGNHAAETRNGKQMEQTTKFSVSLPLFTLSDWIEYTFKNQTLLLKLFQPKNQGTLCVCTQNASYLTVVNLSIWKVTVDMFYLSLNVLKGT